MTIQSWISEAPGRSGRSPMTSEPPTAADSSRNVLRDSSTLSLHIRAGTGLLRRYCQATLSPASQTHPPGRERAAGEPASARARYGSGHDALIWLLPGDLAGSSTPEIASEHLSFLRESQQVLGASSTRMSGNAGACRFR